MFQIQKMCFERDIETEFEARFGALVEDARNAQVSRFLNSDADAIMMLDDDISMDPRVFKRMLDFDRGVVGCYYPHRHIDLKAVVRYAKQGIAEHEAIERASPLIGGDPDEATDRAISQVKWIATGALLVRRFVFERIIEQKQVGLNTLEGPDGVRSAWGFFTRIHIDGVGPIGEDKSFCERVSRSGVPIFAYKGPGVFHHGSFRFGSDFR